MCLFCVIMKVPSILLRMPKIIPAPVEKGDIDIAHVGTDMQLVDIFTKPLDEARFCKLRHELGILELDNIM